MEKLTSFKVDAKRFEIFKEMVILSIIPSKNFQQVLRYIYIDFCQEL